MQENAIQLEIPTPTRKMFSGQPNKQTKELNWSLTKDFFIEFMVKNNLHVEVIATHVVAAENGSVLVSVTTAIKDTKGRIVTSGVGSSMSVPGEERYASQSQKACTYSVKQSLEYLIGITNDKVLEMMKEAGIDPGKSSGGDAGSNFGIADEEPAPVVLDDSDGIEI